MSLQPLIDRVMQADLLRFSTAGSVDDGKSTLIGRLLYDSRSIYDDQLTAVEAASTKSGQDTVDLALVTDGLRAEREQRITIDVAYRHFSTPKRRFIIADTPGHEQYTRNMATGASTADLAVVLVDASQGVLTQSRRHGYIAVLLGIRYIVLAVNKMDKVEYDRRVFERIRDEFVTYIQRVGDVQITCIPVSALKGDNVVTTSEHMPWYTGPTLLHYLETVNVHDASPHPFRMAVQYVLRPTPDYRGYSGLIASGTVRQGDAVKLLPSGLTARISEVRLPSGTAPQASAGQAATLCLDRELDVSRGDLLCAPDAPPVAASQIEATVVWMHTEPLHLQRPLLIKHTTRAVRAQVLALHHRIDPNTLEHQSADSLELNAIGQVSIRLFRPLLCATYRANRTTGAFILIDPVTHATVAAGMITEAHASQYIAPGSPNLTRHTGRITLSQRTALMHQQPATVWLTGYSGSGKSTIACALEERLVHMGHPTMVLDGDNIRHGLNRDLGFSPDDRTENIRRVAHVAQLMNEAGLIVIVSFISPYRTDRAAAREIIGPDRFIETLVDTPLAVCEARDPKGLYAKARAGQITDFTGIDAPYERPEVPDLTLDTVNASVDDAVTRCLQALEARGVIPSAT